MPDTLPSLLHRRRPFHTIDAPFYTDEAVCQADLELISSRHWIFVGQEPDVPQPGDVMALHVGDAPILIVRDDDSAMRAFHTSAGHCEGDRSVRRCRHERRSNEMRPISYRRHRFPPGVIRRSVWLLLQVQPEPA